MRGRTPLLCRRSHALRGQSSFSGRSGGLGLHAVLWNARGLDDKLDEAGYRTGLILKAASLQIDRDVKAPFGIQPRGELFTGALAFRSGEAFDPVKIDAGPNLRLDLVDVLATGAGGSGIFKLDDQWNRPSDRVSAHRGHPSE